MVITRTGYAGHAYAVLVTGNAYGHGAYGHGAHAGLLSSGLLSRRLAVSWRLLGRRLPWLRLGRQIWPTGGFYWGGGFYNSLYWPRLGFSVGFLPYGYYPFYWGGLQFYYSDGYYYNNDNGQYTVVEPPVGAQLNNLPEGAKSIMINGQQYYELNGVYYVACY